MIENEDEDEHEDENVCRTCVNLHNCNTDAEPVQLTPLSVSICVHLWSSFGCAT